MVINAGRRSPATARVALDEPPCALVDDTKPIPPGVHFLHRIVNVISSATCCGTSGYRHSAPPPPPTFVAPSVVDVAADPPEPGSDLRHEQTHELMALLHTKPGARRDEQVRALMLAVHNDGAQFSLRQLDARGHDLLHALVASGDDGASLTLIARLKDPQGGYARAESARATEARNAAGQTPMQVLQARRAREDLTEMGRESLEVVIGLFRAMRTVLRFN